MIDKALNFYNINNPTATFIRHNENMTYKITDTTNSYVLRIHKPVEGFNIDYMRMGVCPSRQVASEMELLQYLYNKGNVATQKVICNHHGETVTRLDDGTPVTVLEWINGDTLDSIEITEEIAKEIGIMIGQLHRRR